MKRFSCPTMDLSLPGLLRKGTRGFWVALTLAVAVHASLTQWRLFEGEHRAAKPLTTRFLKREPRLVKPLELRKRPRLRRRPMRRREISVKAPALRSLPSTTPYPYRVLDNLARPRTKVERSVPSGEPVSEPAAAATPIETTREVRNIVNMALEALDLDALDTGRYRAMVIQDSRDKRRIKGYLHLASAYPATASLPDNEVRRWVNIIQALVEAMNRFTNIRTDFQGKMTFDSSELLKLPFLYTRMYWPFRLSDSESNNLGLYLVQGGFLFAESVPPGWSSYFPAYQTIRGMIRRALETQGLLEHSDWDLERLPKDHPVYHCYFDFDGPPVGTEWKREEYINIDYLEGVILEGRVLAIISQKNYAHPWADWGILPHYRDKDPTRQLQFGVNLIIFALTQEGSITHQVMNMVY